MTVIALPDTEGALRTWLRSKNLALVGQAVYFAVPSTSTGAAPPLPLLTVSRVGGRPDGYVPLDAPRCSISIYAGTKHDAARITGDVVARLMDLEAEALDASTFVYGAEVESMVWMPDPETRTPRYVVDVVLTVRAATP